LDTTIIGFHMNHLKENILRNLGLWIALSALLSACSTPATYNTTSTTTNSSPSVAALPPAVIAYSDAWTKLDGEKVFATFAPDGVYIDPQVPKGLTGKAIAKHVESFKGISVKIGKHDFLADGRPRTFWEVYDSKGKLLAKGHDHFTMANGKIARMEGFFDPM
jgi:hypothetical protein